MVALVTRKTAPSSSSTDAGDQALVERCLKGDQRAWEEVVNRFGRLVYSVPIRHGLPSADADEVFQRTFDLLFRHLTSIRDRTRLSSWLITTAKRETYRVGRRSARFESATEVMLGECTASEQDASASMEREELRGRVNEALEELPARDRQLLRLLFAGDGSRSYEDIALEVGVPVGSIGPTRARALGRLKTILERSQFASPARF